MTLTIKIIHKKKISWHVLDDCLYLITHLPRVKKKTNIIKKIFKYAIAYIDNKPVGIVCIKHAKESYIKHISQRAGISSLPKYELGYCYTEKKYRNQGISKKLIGKLLYMKLFATTKDNNIPMQKILKKYKFKKIGHTFSSTLGPYNIIVMKLS